MSWSKVGDNKYRIFISDGTNLDGSRRRFTKTITTSLRGRDLKDYMTLKELEFKDEVKRKDPRFDKLARGSFRAYSDWWLEYIKVEDKTRQGYEYLLNSRILPLIGDKALDKLTTGDMLELMKWIENDRNQRTGKPLSLKTVKHYHTILKNMFNDAVSLKIIGESPMDNVPVETPSHKVRDNFYTVEETAQLLALLAKEPVKYQLGILLAISTGMRVGEISALQWKHIDVADCSVLIEQVNSYAFNESKIKDMPKTESSFRKVSIPPSILPILEQHRENEHVKKEHLKDEWFYGYDNPHGEDFIFTQRNGKMMYIHTLSQWFLKFRRKHNLKDVTFHGLRHTSTVAMVMSGINITNISSKLGHAKTSTTQDIYSHALMDVEKESANVFENIIQNAQNETNGTKTGTKKNNLRLIK